LDDDFLRQILAIVPVPAVRVADFVEDLLVLIHQDLKLFLQCRRRHRLCSYPSAAIAMFFYRSTCYSHQGPGKSQPKKEKALSRKIAPGG
jgi:hypothetical protein